MPAAERPPVVLLGGAVNALSAARSLGRRGVPVVALGESRDWEPVSSSRFVRRYVGLGAGTRADEVQRWWAAWLERPPAAVEGAVVLPCSDHGLELTARNRARLVALGLRPVEADDALVLDLLDKARTGRVAEAAGVDAPRVFTVDGAGSPPLDDVVEAVRFPCALKPVHSHRAPAGFGAKGVVVADRDELAAGLRAAAAGGAGGAGVVVTEIVPGPDDAFCSYYTYLVDGEPLFHFTKRKLRQFPVRWGTGTYHLAQWDAEAHEVGLRLFQAVGLVGLGNAEFKRDERDGKLKLIECNLRLTAADPLIQRCGLDLPWLLYRRAAGDTAVVPGPLRYGARQWHPLPDVRALLAYRRAGELSVAAWARSLLHRQTLPLWAADDLRPSVRNAREVAVRAARAVRR